MLVEVGLDHCVVGAAMLMAQFGLCGLLVWDSLYLIVDLNLSVLANLQSDRTRP